MITEQDLRAAIAECEGTRNPNANTCIKLAAYYTILNNMTEDTPGEPTSAVHLPMPVSYSYDAGTLPYSDSEFSEAVERKGIDQAFPIIDELMNALMVLNPRLYKSVIRKIEDL